MTITMTLYTSLQYWHFPFTVVLESTLMDKKSYSCYLLGDLTTTNTKSLAKAFSKILIILIEYFCYLKIGIDVFFDADSESPRMT